MTCKNQDLPDFNLLRKFDCVSHHSCSLQFLASSCPASRAPAGMRSSPVNSALICTRGTSSLCAQRASRLCATTWGPTSTSTYTTETANSFVCAVCRTSTSSANQSVAQRTCFTDCCCTQRSSSTLWRSHTGGPENALVSDHRMDGKVFWWFWIKFVEARWWIIVQYNY